MKEISTALSNHLNGDTTTLALLWKVTKRNGDIILGTDHDRDITITTGAYAGIYVSGTTNVSGSDISQNSDMSVDNMEVTGAFPDSSFPDTINIPSITQLDIESGLLNYARVVMLTVNWASPDDGQIVIKKGFFGPLTYDTSGMYKTEVRGLADLLSANIGMVYSDRCDVKRFGDARCKFDASTVTVLATVTAVASRRNFTVGGFQTHPEGWYNYGILTGVTGKNTGFIKQIRIDNADGVGGSGVATTIPGVGGGTTTGGGGTVPPVIIEPGGSTGGGVPGGGGSVPTGLPAAVTALGLTVQTFGPSPRFTNDYTGMYFPAKFFGYTGGTVTNNTDGSAVMNGGLGNLVTAGLNTAAPGQFYGNAFGPPLYAEAEIVWDQQDGLAPDEWPAFWALPIESMAYNSARPETHWPGQATNYIDFDEVDIMEYDAGQTGVIGSGLHNWYDIFGSGSDMHTHFPPQAILDGSNKYAILWVPATDSAQGYYAHYVNGELVWTQLYNKYNPATPPPPVLGANAFSHNDLLHLAFIFNTSTKYPMTIKSFSVWQKDTTTNLQHPEPTATPPPPTTGGGTTGGGTTGTPTTADLYVSTSKIMQPDGTEFRIRGMDICHYDSGWTSASSAKNSGANTVRIFVPLNTSTITTLVTDAHNQDLIPVITMAGFPSGGATSGNNSTGDFSGGIDWWVANVAALKDLHPMIINIANEWLSSANAATWKSSYISAVQRMRIAGYTQILMCDTDGYGQDYSTIYSSAAAVLAADTLHNTMFSYHLYGNTPDNATMVTNFNQMHATNLCICIGEFGPGRNIGPSPTLITPDQVIAAAEGADLGWIAWAWDDNDLAGAKASDNWFSMTTGNPNGVGSYALGQENRDLTTFGRDVVAKMKAMAVKSTIFGSGFMSSFAHIQSLEATGDGLGTAVLSLFEPLPEDVEIGDTFYMVAGCDRLLATCYLKFNNLTNFRGFGVYIPGIDKILQGPVGATDHSP